MKSLMIACCFLTPAMAQAAGIWSSCQTITAITDEPNLSSVLVTLSPGITGCSPQGVTGAITFAAAQDGIVSSDLNGLLATSLSAFTLGKRVLIAYDNSTSNCYSHAVSIGGYAGQCP
jgi:hypothetical protein